MPTLAAGSPFPNFQESSELSTKDAKASTTGLMLLLESLRVLETDSYRSNLAKCFRDFEWHFCPNPF